jgi:hypothetical protein
MPGLGGYRANEAVISRVVFQPLVNGSCTDAVVSRMEYDLIEGDAILVIRTARYGSEVSFALQI